MGLCKSCSLYSEHYDNLSRDFNDIGDENNHFCPMYENGMPEQIFAGNGDCDYYERRPESWKDAVMSSSDALTTDISV